MSNRDKSHNKYNHGQMVWAYKVAKRIYENRNSDGTLRRNKEIAEELNIAEPRVGEHHRNAWKAGLIDAVVMRPESFLADLDELEQLENMLLDRLKIYSPAYNGGIESRPHKLMRVHIVINPSEGFFERNSTIAENRIKYISVSNRICRRAAREYYDLIKTYYDRVTVQPDTRLYCGIGWRKTCLYVVNNIPTPPDTYHNLTICPLIGIIGHKDNELDANFLALRLSKKMSGGVIKLPFPSFKPLGLPLDNIRPIKRALEDINKCMLGLSGVGLAYDRENTDDTELLKRKVISEEQLQHIIDSGGVAEINGHYLKANGDHLEYDRVGFEPVGISFERMREMPRFMVVLGPDKRKIKPMIATIKAGICSDLVIDHHSAKYILNENNAAELGLA